MHAHPPATEPLPDDETRSPLVPDPTIPGPSRRHLPALDGLRGVAILAVLLFHGFTGLRWSHPLPAAVAAVTQAGWLGVDVFFVLSGFLITGILLDTRTSPAYFRNFYARRLLRIVPVYYLLLAIVFGVLPWFIPFGSEGLRIIQQRQGWLWAHLTNIGFMVHRKVWAIADWLDLSHLWSLAVEEQFYLVWPVVVFLLPRGRLKAVCWACIVGSLALRIVLWQTGQRNGALYFPTPCRLDGLAMGGLVAILVRQGDWNAASARLARIGGWASAACLAAIWAARGGLILTDKPTVVFAVTAAGVLTACIVASIGRPAAAGPLSTALKLPWLCTLGKYSYGLYLFHNLLRRPLEAVVMPALLGGFVGSKTLGNLLFVAMYLGLCFATAVVSWHVFEKHWLTLKTRFDYRQ